ncbi:MAG: beta-lactamase family protein [Thermoclostridium sp.]|nr:beta-lactamase family protein [Thermoclostridium sp.]
MLNRKDDDIRNWEVAYPEAAGIPSRAVLGFLDELEQKGLCMHGFAILKDGRILSEGYYAPFHANFAHRMFSASKSFTSAAIGLLQEEGKLSLNDRICIYFPDKLPKTGVHPYLLQTTIRDMLRMASPHKATTYKLMECDDWVKTFFHVEPVRYPGTSFVYDTSATHVLAALVERLSGMSLLEYLKIKVFNKLDCSRYISWLKCPMGICQGGSGLICTLRDLAKFAYVCMHEGVFNTDQLLPREYICQAVSRQIDTGLQPGIEEQQGYGYQFWRCRNNGFALCGMGGQLAICLPEHDFMLAATADNQANPCGIQGIYEALWHQIFPYLKGKNQAEINRDEAYATELEKRISSLTVQPEQGSFHSDTAERVHGKKYIMAPNAMGITECMLKFTNEQTGVFRYANEKGAYRISFGLGQMQQQAFPQFKLQCITSAAWVEENKLRLRSYIIEQEPGSVHMTITFMGDTITIAMKRTIGNLLDTYEGFASGVAEYESR